MTNDKILELTANVVAAMLDISKPEIRFLRNYKEGLLGLVCEEHPDVVFLDIPQIKKMYGNDENIISFFIIKTLMHEMRHLWQQKNNWEYELDTPYYERKSEIDAEFYADYHIDEVISEVYAMTLSA